MANSKVRRQDQFKMTSTTSTTDNYIRPRPKRIFTMAKPTFSDTYIKPAYIIAMQIYELLLGIFAFVSAILYAVIRKIYIPNIEPSESNKTSRASKKSKGKKGKAASKPAAPQQKKPAGPLNTPSPHPLEPQTSPLASPSTSTASARTLKDVAPLDLSATPTDGDAVLPSAKGDETFSKSVKPVLHEEARSAHALLTIMGIASPRKVSMSPAIPLSDARLLFQLAEENESEEAVSSTTSSQSQTPCLATDIPSLTDPSQGRPRAPHKVPGGGPANRPRSHTNVRSPQHHLEYPLRNGTRV